MVDILGRVEPEPPISPPAPSVVRPERGGRSTLDTALRAARRRIVVLLVCALAAPLAAYLYSSSKPKEYTATADLLLRNLNLDQKLFSTSSFSPNTDPQRDANTNLRLITLQAVAAQTARQIGLTPVAVQSAVKVSPAGDSDVVDVAATSEDPATAAKIANTFGAQYIAFRRDQDRAQVLSAQQLIQARFAALAPAERSSVPGQVLAKQIQNLNVIAALQTGNAELVQSAIVPTSASGPHPTKMAIVGLLAGLLLGGALVFLLERLDQRLKEREDVEDAFGLPVLTQLPESRSIGGGRDGDFVVRGPESEAFALLRSALRFYTVERPVRSVVVTSPAPGDGKTTVALNLAAAAARAGEDVLLIEADLRRPQLASRLSLPPSRGLSSVLARRERLRRASVPFSLNEAGGSGGAELRILPAGPSPPNPAQLLESDNMHRLLDEAEHLFDLVVIDTPPTSSVPDTLPLMSWASAVLVVCRLGRTKRGAAALVRQQLDSTTAAPLGIVLNGSSSSALDYYQYRSEEPAPT